MTVPSEARVTQRAEEVAEDVTSAANIVTNGGYYEIDTNAVTAVITRFEAEVRQSATAPLLEALEAAREALATAERVMLWAERRMACDDYAKVIANDARNTAQTLTRITAALAAHKGEG